MFFNPYYSLCQMNSIIVFSIRGDVNGDRIPDNLFLTGVKTIDSPFIQNITLVIQDGRTGMINCVPLEFNAGYNPTLFLGDFTGDGINEILISIASGGSGGIMFYYIYSYLGNIPKLLFDFNVFNKAYQYHVMYKDYYKVEVINITKGINYIIDISNKDQDYLNEIYDAEGKLIAPIEGFVSPLSGLYPIDFDSNGVYELLGYQRISGRFAADALGFIQTILKWNGNKFAFNNQYVAILGGINKCLPNYKDSINLTQVECLYSEKEKNVELEKALEKEFNLIPGKDKVRYYHNRIDLNSDGKPETFVYLVGPTVCGTGGCSAAIFKNENGNYRLLTKFTLVNNPIIISDHKTKGYNDLIMYVSGGGIESFFAEVKYNGTGYPSNPSIQPKLKPGTIVKGVAIIADDITSNPGIEL